MPGNSAAAAAKASGSQHVVDHDVGERLGGGVLLAETSRSLRSRCRSTRVRSVMGRMMPRSPTASAPVGTCGDTPPQLERGRLRGCPVRRTRERSDPQSERPLGSASSSSPTTPPPRWPRRSADSPSRSRDRRPRPGLRRRQHRRHLRRSGWPSRSHRPCRSPSYATSTTSATAATRRPATRGRMEHGLDIVVLLHGDGQYAPEVIERLVEPLARGEADAVFGSRMMVKGAGPSRRHAARTSTSATGS